MSRHPLVPLHEVLTPSKDSVAVAPTETYEMAGIYSFGRGLFRKPAVSGTETSYKAFNPIKTDRFVYSRLFAWEGAVAVVPPEFDGFFVSTEFPTFDINRKRALPKYLSFICRWPQFHRQMAGATTGLGLRRQRVYEDALLKLAIPLPPIDEQRRIATRLDKALAKVEAVATRAAQVDVATLLALFPVLVDRAFAKNGSSTVRLGDAVTVVTDTLKPGEDPSPAEAFVSLNHLETHTGRLLGFDDVGAEKAEKRRFSAGDIVYGTLRPNLNKVWVADRHGLCSVDQRVLRPRDGFDPELVAHGIRSASFLSQVMALVPGLQLPRIRLTRLLELNLQTVGEAEAANTLSDIGAALARITSLVEVRLRRERLLRALTPSLLNAVFAP